MKLVSLSKIIIGTLFLGGIIYPQENYLVRSIDFEGNETLSKSDILENALMYETGWFSETILGDDPYLFSGEVLEDDLIQIKQYYQREGFLNVKIDQPLLLPDNEDKLLEILISIEEGDPVLVDTIIIDHSREFVQFDKDSLYREINKNLNLKSGTRFRDAMLIEDRGIIYEYFSNIGYPYCKIEFDLSVDESENRVKILWSVDTGIEAKFGEISLTGSERFEDDIFEPRITIDKGDKYSNEKLIETQKYIYSLGLHSVVSVQASLEDSTKEKIPVNINLKELPKYRTRLGLGYGKDEKFRVTIDQTINGFLGTIGRLTIEGKHSDLEPYKFGLRYILPDFIYPLTTLIIYPYIRKQTEPAFTLNRRGNRTTIQRYVIWDIDLALTHTFENINLDTASISTDNRSSDLIDNYNKSSITLSLLRITSDPFFDPIGGMYQALQLTYSGLGFNSKYQFNKAILELRRYDNISDWVTLAYKFKIGNITSYDSSGFIPVEERFYAGGANSIRGWGRSELGPLGSDEKPLGGNSLLELGLELRFPVTGEFSGVLFTDFGNVWLDSWTYKLDELRFGLGAGIRYSTPIGPIRFDIATPIFDEEKKINFYFSVGHAF
jgi:outer membrane protein insertion porin family